MKIIITLSIFLIITNISVPSSDSTKNIDTAKIKTINSMQSRTNSYQKILLDSNSSLVIKEINNESIWSIRNLIPIIVSLISLYISLRALATTKNNFKREHVINLFDYWERVNNINPTNPIYVDVKNAVNALTLTSIIWNYEIIDKRIIYTSHWNAFKTLYDTLINCNIAPNGSLQICSSYITSDITQAYTEMSFFN